MVTFINLQGKTLGLKQVEFEESAYPYHDWNARITAECYAPNSASRIMDPEWRIIGIA